MMKAMRDMQKQHRFTNAVIKDLATGGKEPDSVGEGGGAGGKGGQRFGHLKK